MAKNVEEIIKNVGSVRRKKIESRAAQLIAEEMTRQELRRALERTQVDLAKKLGITQDSVSRLEQRTDLLLSTLRAYVAALGGRLSLVAEFPDHEPVVLSGIAGDEMKPLRSRGRKRTKSYGETVHSATHKRRLREYRFQPVSVSAFQHKPSKS